MDRIAEHRQFFARLITANAGILAGSELEAAFASTPREQFVAPSPWKVFTPRGYIETTSNDPTYLYQDIVVSLGSSQGPLNNGQPSLHAYCIHALNLKKDERVVHIGAGTGYYTAILAKLVGESGQVHAYEIEPELAMRAMKNLAPLAQVTVHSRSGTISPLPACDAIYVNAGATEPLAIWLDALEDDGRLLFPLTDAQGSGAMLLITRRDGENYEARFLTQVVFVPCMGARDDATAKKLTQAFRNRNWTKVRTLYRNREPDRSCWLAGNGWWLSTR